MASENLKPRQTWIKDRRAYDEAAMGVMRVLGVLRPEANQPYRPRTFRDLMDSGSDLTEKLSAIWASAVDHIIGEIAHEHDVPGVKARKSIAREIRQQLEGTPLLTRIDKRGGRNDGE